MKHKLEVRQMMTHEKNELNDLLGSAAAMRTWADRLRKYFDYLANADSPLSHKQAFVLSEIEAVGGGIPISSLMMTFVREPLVLHDAVNALVDAGLAIRVGEHPEGFTGGLLITSSGKRALDLYREIAEPIAEAVRAYPSKREDTSEVRQEIAAAVQRLRDVAQG